jgi:(R,R)-butanediol dehydrogenase / meso-butanediol dehydrogenase / diacetyl reductase
MSMEAEALVIYAQHNPMPGVLNPGPHQTYKNTRIAVKKKVLGRLRPDCIRVELLYAGVCGTDLHLVQKDPCTGYVMTSCPMNLPEEGRVFGHEGIGRILEVGAGVSSLKPGSLVALESIEVCRRCDRCLVGQFNQCRHSSLVGMEQDGLFTTIADVPASLAYDVSALVHSEDDAQALACLEPAGVAWVACQNARIQPGEHVVVFGAGPIGVLCAMLARTVFGAGQVHVVEPSAFRRQFVARHADHTYTPEEFFASDITDIDVVFEASGYMENIDRVLPRMNAEGRVVVLARGGKPLILNATDHLITNAISITGSRGHLGGAFQSLLGLYREGRFNPGEIVTGIVDGLPALAALLKDPARLVESSCKVLVQIQRPVVTAPKIC